MASEVEVMLPATPTPAPLAVRHELEVGDVVAQVQKIQHVMAEVMKEGEHYGKIPGTNKPTLFKAGAEKLCVTFRLRPEFESAETWDGVHLTVKSRCILVHIPTGQVFGTGEGMCSTKESKYAYRGDGRVCPSCGASTIKKSKYPPKSSPKSEPGFYCFAKIGGCGAEFFAGDESITSQPEGRAPNPDIADLYNTVLKMANKRSHTAAVLLSTAASDIFTQDLEDLPQATPPAQQAPKGKSPDEQKAEVLDRIYKRLKAAKLMTKVAEDERKAALWHAFETKDWEQVKTLEIQALRDGLSVLDAMLTQKTMPGDDSIPFGDSAPDPYESPREPQEK